MNHEPARTEPQTESFVSLKLKDPEFCILHGMEALKFKIEQLEHQNRLYRESLGHIANLADEYTMKNYDPIVSAIREQVQNGRILSRRR